MEGLRFGDSISWRNSMKIQSKVKDYSVEFIDDIFDKRAEIFGMLPDSKKYFFVDAGVYRRYQNALNRFIGENQYCVIEALEMNKEYGALAKYYKILIESGFTRRDCLVTIGGGILQDISGFIASTLYRGIPWVFIPTTLLAQADSCIGSKTSINFSDTKNLIGSFYPPDKIFIDVGLCDTLTESYFNSGLGEIIKYHLMADQKMYILLKQYLGSGHLRARNTLDPILRSSLEIKRSYFEEDEFDSGRRNLLNYGHCFGHALESATQFRVSHGEAVIVGMGFANLLSLKRDILRKDVYEEIEGLLRPHYPDMDFKAIPVDTVIRFMRKDKKRMGNNLTMILVQGIGDQRKYDDVTEDEVRQCFEDFIKQYPVRS